MGNRTTVGLIALVLAALALPATALALLLVRTGHAAVRVQPARVHRIPASSTSNGVPEIGALYASSRATRHTCTASVVDSRRGNTLITAAHCVAGSGIGMVFVPGQHGTQMPYGRWTVTAAYLEPKWLTRQDPDADAAFLTVAPRSVNGVSVEIERVTGAYALGTPAVRDQRITITSYPAGGANNPITCSAKIYLTGTFPSLDCRGFVSGTSGGPWLNVTQHGTQIVGVIGGLHQGGCYDYTSYTSRLARDVGVAYMRASRNAPADEAPQADGDGC